MINKLKNKLVFFFFVFSSCLRLIIVVPLTVIGAGSILSDGTFWFAVFYQFGLVLIVITLFATHLDTILYNLLNGQPYIIPAIILFIVIISIIMLINALVELSFRIKYKNDHFNNFFLIQTHAHNYFMALISLIAIYAAIDTRNALATNTLLLSFGVLIFICMLATDIYDSLFLSQGIVKEIYDRLQRNYTAYLKSRDKEL